MINKIILDKISESLSAKLEDFKNLTIMEDELNIDKYIKQEVIKIIMADLLEINTSLSSSNITIKALLTKEQYFCDTNVRNNESDISKFCDLVLVYQEAGVNKDAEIEIKKTKSNFIPGSSIKQIKPEKAILFFKYHNSEVELEVGYYFQTVCERIPFPDRSPRPTISYNYLKETNEAIRKNVLSLKIVKDRNKTIFQDNWMDQLVLNWMDDVTATKLKRNWFFIIIRKFCLKAINYYEKLSEEDKKAFKENLKKEKS